MPEYIEVSLKKNVARMLFIIAPKADIFKLKEKRLNINAKKIIIPILYF